MIQADQLHVAHAEDNSSFGYVTHHRTEASAALLVRAYMILELVRGDLGDPWVPDLEAMDEDELRELYEEERELCAYHRPVEVMDLADLKAAYIACGATVP